MKIVLITCGDRPELFVQTVRSMQENASDWSKHDLLAVIDGSEIERRAFEAAVLKPNGLPIRTICTGRRIGVGGAKNIGAGLLGKGAADSEIVMFSDGDMYYLPRWDRQLESGLRSGDNQQPRVVQLGGWRHPFHNPGRQLIALGIGGIGKGSGYTVSAHEVDAVTGNCFVIRWSDWLKYGPFDSNALGPGQSEDFALSQKIKAGGGLVATLDPPVAIHCGITNSEGKVATGWEEMLELAMCQIHEYGLLDKVDLMVPDAVKVPRSRSREDAPAATDVGGASQRGQGDARSSRVARPFLGLNIGSGQRRFDVALGWVNVDSQSVPPNRVPDLICNVGKESLPYSNKTVDYVVSQHSIEHVGCGEASSMIRECWRVLKPGGSLIITVPDMQKLAARWLGGEITDQLYFTNVYGAFMGSEDDRHKWGYSWGSLYDYIRTVLGDDDGELDIQRFDWRTIPGADIAQDWWILGVEVVKA